MIRWLVAPIQPKAMITILEPTDHERWLRSSYDEVVAPQRPYAAERMSVRGPVFPTRERLVSSDSCAERPKAECL